MARLAALLLVVVVAVLSLSGLVSRGLIGTAQKAASAADRGTADGVERPGAPER